MQESNMNGTSSPLSQEDVERERLKLEQMELEAPSCIPAPEIYAKLMLIYFIEENLCQAKFLWKRIPDEVKTTAPELGRLWNIGKALFQDDPPAFHTAIQGEWPHQFEAYLEKLSERTRDRYLRAIGNAYSSISMSDFCQYLGVSEAESRRIVHGLPGWGLDEGSSMVLPRRPVPPSAQAEASEKRLERLTDYVVFLEK